MTIDTTIARAIYAKLVEVRHFEQRCTELYRDGAMPGFLHVSLGQEACAVGACLALERDDYVTSTHRGQTAPGPMVGHSGCRFLGCSGKRWLGGGGHGRPQSLV